MIPEEVVQEVLSRADILQVIGDYVTLKRVGNSFKGLCPLHGEKTPSFHVTPSKGLFYCFGCGQGGTAVDFVMRMEGTSFPETIEALGGRFGVEVVSTREDTVAHSRKRQGRDEMLSVLKTCEQFFSQSLQESEEAQAYLVRRKIGEEMVKLFHLGYAPHGWETLSTHLAAKSITARAALNAGMVIEKERGDRSSYYDRFRHRLIFPVLSAKGETIAFGGRTLDPEADAKYINSPETPLYKKGQNLYGLHAAKEAARRAGRFILVEGNIDVIRMVQAGFAETVAPMGTALTEDQARLLKRYAPAVTLLFDGDKAGQKAALRVIAPLQAAEVDAQVCVLPKGEDPDSFLDVFGAEEMGEILSDHRPLVQWAIDSACEAALARPVEARTVPLAVLNEILNTLSSSVVQRHYLAEAARKLGYQPGELTRLLERGQPAQRIKKQVGTFSQNPEHRPQQPTYQEHPIERELLGILLDAPDKLRDFVDSDGLLLIEDGRVVRLLDSIGKKLERSLDIREAVEELDDGELKRLAFETLIAGPSVEKIHVEDWYRGAVASLTRRWVERETIIIANQLADALSAGDEEAQQSLNHRYQQLQELRQKTNEDRMINWETLVSEL